MLPIMPVVTGETGDAATAEDSYGTLRFSGLSAICGNETPRPRRIDGRTSDYPSLRSCVTTECHALPKTRT